MKINSIRPDEHIFLRRLSTIADPPKCLYYIGKLPENPPLTVAIVGTRRPTAYGRTVTEQVASALAQRGVLIVSGLALGVDAIAHQTAIASGGRTLAVVASGIDDPGPHTNRSIAERIVAQGDAIIGEREPGYTIRGAWEFVIRNRIVSGLSDAVIVTEANLKSGTMTTVSQALDQGRAVYAVPGPITSPLSAGCNRLIAQGATPITDIDSLLSDLGLTGQSTLALGENDAEATLLQLLQSGISDGDELLSTSQLTPDLFSQTLTMLEIKGIVKALGGNRWRI